MFSGLTVPEPSPCVLDLLLKGTVSLFIVFSLFLLCVRDIGMLVVNFTSLRS